MSLEQCKVSAIVLLEPAYLAEPMRGVQDALNSLILGYWDQVQGVVLAYWDTKLKQRTAQIFPDQAQVALPVQVKLLVFRFGPGTALEGTVSKVGVDHIALEVCGALHVSVAAADGGLRVALGDTVRVRVQTVQYRGDYLAISAEMLEEA